MSHMWFIVDSKKKKTMGTKKKKSVNQQKNSQKQKANTKAQFEKRKKGKKRVGS